MKNYWLTLHKDTFLWIKGEDGCVYNTVNRKLLRFRNEGVLQPFVADLLQVDNLYKTRISEEYLLSGEVRKWVDDLLSIECAEFIEDNLLTNREVSYIPELKIQDRVSYYKFKHDNGEDGGIMMHLHKLIIHLNGSKYGNEDYSKQVIFPEKRGAELPKDAFSQFLYSFGEPSFLAEIVLVGCLWEHTEYDGFWALFKSLNIPISIYCTERDFAEHVDAARLLMEEPNVSVYVLFADYSLVGDCQFTPVFENSKVHWCFVVTSEKDYMCAESLVDQHRLKESRFAPVYTGDNLTFFEENSYMTEDDLQGIRLSKREIFAHQTLNTHFFATLTIHPDGLVFSDPAQTAIGTIEEGLYTIVYREMVEGNAWFRIRDQQPCSECIYQYLCPSPSPYEQAIGQLNLCHVN